MTIYLDYAATTPVRPAVARRMAEVMTDHGANPASTHGPGREAASIVAASAVAVGRLINAAPEEIVWTSGATESINLALKGIAEFYHGGHIVSIVTEHRATLDALTWLEKQGARVTRLGVDAAGHIDLNELAAVIGD